MRNRQPNFQHSDKRTLTELVSEIAFVENFPVWLKCEGQRFFKPYPLQHSSFDQMTGQEWVVQFEKWYPNIEVTILHEKLKLRDLRHTPWP